MNCCVCVECRVGVQGRVPAGVRARARVCACMCVCVCVSDSKVCAFSFYQYLSPLIYSYELLLLFIMKLFKNYLKIKIKITLK